VDAGKFADARRWPRAALKQGKTGAWLEIIVSPEIDAALAGVQRSKRKKKTRFDLSDLEQSNLPKPPLNTDAQTAALRLLFVRRLAAIRLGLQ
jgi:hypothetical protein